MLINLFCCFIFLHTKPYLAALINTLFSWSDKHGLLAFSIEFLAEHLKILTMYLYVIKNYIKTFLENSMNLAE